MSVLPEPWSQSTWPFWNTTENSNREQQQSPTSPIMGGFLTLVEDRPTPKAVYNWRVYASAAVASFASMMIGYDSAFIGTTLALPSFTDEFRFEELSASHLALVKANIVSIYQVGSR